MFNVAKLVMPAEPVALPEVLVAVSVPVLIVVTPEYVLLPLRMSSPAPDLVSPAPAPLTPPEKIVRAVFDTVTVGVALPRVIGPENSKPVAPAIVKLWLIVTALGMALMPVRSV